MEELAALAALVPGGLPKPPLDTAWFAARPDPCAEPKGFVHLAGYGFKPYRPMLLKLLAHRPNSSAPPLEPMEARGLCLAFQSVLSTIEDPRSGVPRVG